MLAWFRDTYEWSYVQEWEHRSQWLSYTVRDLYARSCRTFNHRVRLYPDAQPCVLWHTEAILARAALMNCGASWKRHEDEGTTTSDMELNSSRQTAVGSRHTHARTHRTHRRRRPAATYSTRRTPGVTARGTRKLRRRASKSGYLRRKTAKHDVMISDVLLACCWRAAPKYRP